MPHDTEEFNYSFLPLWNLPRWEQAARDAGDEQALSFDETWGTDRDTGSAKAFNLYIAKLQSIRLDFYPSADVEYVDDNEVGTFYSDLYAGGFPAQGMHDPDGPDSQADIAGDLGPRPSIVATGAQRADWWYILQEMNGLLQLAKNMGHDIFEGADSRIRPETVLGSDDAAKDVFMTGKRPASPELPKYKYNGQNTPDLFIFKKDALTRHITFTPYIIMLRFVALHNALFWDRKSGHKIVVTRSHKNILAIDRPLARSLMRNVRLGLELLREEILIQEELAIQRELHRLALEAAMEGADSAGFVREPLSPEELDVLTDKPEYQKYFSTTFSKEIITFVPIMQNFFLTGKYFQNINESFYASNALALEILISTIRNDDNYKNKPDLRRLPPSLAGTVDDQLDKHSASARDFILKMLIMTPINILKGLCELIDPHVGLTKIIKNVTGYAFDELAEVLNVPAEGINVARKEAQAAIQQIDVEEVELQGINGDDLLKFILCILQVLMESLADVPRPLDDDGNPLMPTLPPNFFPDIERDGINFTGKISGLLMMPPTPLGLIYLLLGLIKFGEDEVVDALQPPDPEVCLDPEEASVTVEATEDLCEPGEVP